jgi:protease-4
LSQRRDLFVLLFFLLAFALFFYLIVGLLSPRPALNDLHLAGGEKVALLEIFGPIYNPLPILDQLKKIEEDSGVKAILLRLETPGGGVAASQEIYRRLAYLRDAKQLPIVASMGGIAASGGYYVALGADTIMANPGTLTGSIGVIAEFPTYGRLLQKIGVDMEVIKSGKFKDAGSPHRLLTEEERAYLQGVIDDSYGQFLAVVSQERQIDEKKAELLADGRVYTGRQAQELGLIDLLGGWEDALKLAGEMGGISGAPRVVEFRRKRLTLFHLLFDDLEEILLLRLGLAAPLKYEMPQSFP